MYKIIILPVAKKDIKDAADWYNSRQAGLGKKFTQEVRNTVQYISNSPEAYAIRYDETRCVILAVFPMMIHYVIKQKQETIIISAIFHTSLNPAKWMQRQSV